MPNGTPSRVPVSVTDRIIKVVLFYAVFAALWILLSDKAVEWIFSEPELITLASTIKGWLFVAVTSLLLYGLMRRLLGGDVTEPMLRPAIGLRPLLPLALIAVAIIVLTGVSIVHTFKHERDKEVGRLQAIADLKARQISDWLRERDGDMHFVQSSRFFAETYRHWKDAGDASSGEVLKKRLNEFREDRFFKGVILLDEKNEVLWGSEGAQTDLNPALKSGAQHAATEGKSLYVGPFRDADGRLHLDLVAPLLLVDSHPGPTVVLRLDPAAYLFPILQTWPASSTSGETLLFKNDGGEVLYLNDLRQSKDSAALLRMPVAEKDLLAAQVLRGEAKLGSLVKGVDYRGVPVMGVARTISGTDWFLVAKVDLGEFHVEAIRDALWIALAGVFALFMTIACFFFFRQHQELVFSLRQRESQAEKLRALQLLDAIAEGSSDAIFAKDREGRYLLFNREAARVTGKRPYEVLGRDDSVLFPSEQAATIAANDRKVMEENRTSTVQEDLTTPHGDITFLATKGPLHNAAGNVIGMFGVSRDITERKRAEETLKESEAKFRLAFQTSPDSINLNRVSDGMYLDINEGFTEITGYTSEDVIGKTSIELNIWEDPKDRERLVAGLGSAGFVENMEAKFRGKDGRIIIGLMSARLLRINQEDVLLSITRDITGRKEAEEERKKLETQLFHAQKLESVGRLAGGVAHDFNNMLGVIIGHADLALGKARPEDSLDRNLQEILKAAHRSADLTRQLLAFARRQTASPKVLDLNDTISGMLMMLRRIIGEDILLAWMPGPHLWSVKIDPSQVDQLLANLAINARDALPGVGKVTIETTNVVFDDSTCADSQGFAPGEYVLLSVSDNGEGMCKEVLDHIFEPFFTTKEVGKGTGLGLATVYGIVKQNQGFVNVYSEPDQGTIFRIYLPRSDGGTVEPETTVLAGKPPLGTETVLIVEDEEAVMNLGRTILERLGYTVLTAGTPGEAICLAGKCAGDIQLLITDVVMPEMNGRELAERLISIKPGLRCLFMSGYTDDAIAHHGVLDEGVHFIQKPFSIQEMAEKVREVLKD